MYLVPPAVEKLILLLKRSFSPFYFLLALLLWSWVVGRDGWVVGRGGSWVVGRGVSLTVLAKLEEDNHGLYLTTMVIFELLLLLCGAVSGFKRCNFHRPALHQHVRLRATGPQPLSPIDEKHNALNKGASIVTALVGATSFLVRPRIVYAVDLPPCDDSVTIFKGKDGRDLIMIGTAHISEESANLVRKTIKSAKPDVVMIELDPKRIARAGVTKEDLLKAGFEVPSGSLQLARPAEKVNPFKQWLGNVVGSAGRVAKDAGGALIGQVLSEFYKSIEKMGFTPGGEFVAAVEEGKTVGARILLGDRDVDLTLQRLAVAISVADPQSFDRLVTRISALEEAAGMTIGPDDEEPTKDTISSFVDSMKQKDLLASVMAAVREELPAVYSALIAERDIYMADAVASSTGKSIVGVCGAAHMEGIERYLTTQRGYNVVKRNCPAPKQIRAAPTPPRTRAPAPVPAPQRTTPQRVLSNSISTSPTGLLLTYFHILTCSF